VLTPVIIGAFALCWGSFLNVIAYRLTHDCDITKARSFCPKCKKTLAFYDLIPVFSWLLLKGRCRSCRQPISWLYIAIELITLSSFILLWYNVPRVYYLAYLLFFSALIITIRTDLETMLICRYVTLFLIPVGVIAGLFKLLPITAIASIVGALLGYFSLWLVAKVFYYMSKKEGIGQGDLELLAFIGSFIGPLGVWASLFIGSIAGSLVGIFYIIYKGASKTTKIPFGPFLALGAIIYTLMQYNYFLINHLI
jgi:leader peptidase (prepilin peptidase) / N-methyltransferase